MQRRLRPLPLALSAGIVAVIAAAVPFYASGALAPDSQLQYTKTTSTKIPGLPGMFQPKPTSETTSISATRMRTDSGNTSEITQCDLKRVVHIDNGAKTYYILTFDQMKAAMDAAMAEYYSKEGMTPPPTQAPGPQPSIQGSGGIVISMNTVNDPNTQQIFGMTAHHVTETITGTATGTGQCPNGTMTMTNDEWYVPTPVKFSCPLPRPNIPVAMPKMPGGQHAGAPNPCIGSFQMQASGKAHSEDRFALKQDTTIDMGVKLTTHEEITKYAITKYDPSVFDAPAGYSQVPPPSNPYGGK